MKPFIWGIVLAWIFWTHHDGLKYWTSSYGFDAKIYYHAASGDLTWNTRQAGYEKLSPSEKAQVGWLYQPFLTVLWKPAILLPEKVFVMVNAVLTTFAYLSLVYKLLEIKYGWIIVLATLRACGLLMVAGNVGLLLMAFMCCLPGYLLAAAVKPPLGLVAILGYIKSIYSCKRV